MERLTDRMSMLSDQIKELRQAAKWFDKACFPDGVRLANEAADTIESLSAKLQVVDMERHYSGGWIPFTSTYDEDKDKFVFDCETPDDGQEILMSDGKYVWKDEFMLDDDGAYLDSGEEFDGTAWMPFPEPYHEP